MTGIYLLENKLENKLEKKLKKKWLRVFCVISYACVITLSGCSMIQIDHQKDDWFGPDKYTHLAVTTAISAAAAKAAREEGHDNCDAALIGFSISMTIGAGKEIYDKRKRKTRYSYRDMIWNTAGSTLGSLAGSNCK